MKLMNSHVDVFLTKEKKWQEEFKILRKIILECDQLTEELKWGKPCYRFQGVDMLMIQVVEEYCALRFCKCAWLKDAKGILIKPGENTQAARQARFTNVREILERQSVLKAYHQEAIEAEKAGLK